MSSDAHIAFWLTPAAGAREFFSALIKELAERYDAPLFEPHVTLNAGVLTEERAVEVLRNLSIRESIELEVEGIEFSARYTKTLFVQFRSTPQIEALSAELSKAVSGDYELNPHLSLLYQELPDKTKADAARAIALAFSSVLFDRVAAVLIPSAIRAREDVEAWQTVASRRLDSDAA
ncbi:MAG: hypothetical protein M3032_02060 [Verrucomicrobiota bacterium]|nr:hypothetical protein [Verrucomicrobiota bacterium]